MHRVSRLGPEGEEPSPHGQSGPAAVGPQLSATQRTVVYNGGTVIHCPRTQ